MKVFTTPAIVEDSSWVLLAYIGTTAAAAAVQSSFSSIALDVYDKENSANAVVSGSSLTIAAVISNTLLYDRGWTTKFATSDALGYNFSYVTPASYLPTGGRVFRFQVGFDFGGGVKTYGIWDVPTLDLMGR